MTRCVSRAVPLIETPSDEEANQLSPKAQSLVAASFSLWRAAFLADRTGKSVFKDAKHFLAKMLIDNAINYAQDRAARDWTFNYYISVAESELLDLGIEWQSAARVYNRPEKDKSRPYAKRRWDRSQTALEAAIRRFTGELKKL